MTMPVPSAIPVGPIPSAIPLGVWDVMAMVPIMIVVMIFAALMRIIDKLLTPEMVGAVAPALITKGL